MNAEHSQVAKLALITDTSMLPIFGHKSHFHLLKFSGRGVTPMGSVVGYPDYLRINQFALEPE